MTGEQAQALIGERFGEGQAVPGPSLTVTVPVERWAELARFAKETLGCCFFSFLSAVDWKEQGLEVVAKVDNVDDNLSLLLKTRLAPGVYRLAETDASRPQ